MNPWVVFWGCVVGATFCAAVLYWIWRGVRHVPDGRAAGMAMGLPFAMLIISLFMGSCALEKISRGLMWNEPLPQPAVQQHSK